MNELLLELMAKKGIYVRSSGILLGHWGRELTIQDIEFLAKEIAVECMESCVKIEDTYLNARLASEDFTYKNQLAEGETACALVAKNIKDKFFK